MKFFHHLFEVAIFFGGLLLSCSYAQERIIYEDHFNVESVPIYKSRIYVVPEAMRSRALALLKCESFRPISKRTLAVIFPGQEFNDRRMLDDQIEAAQVYARERQRAASESPFRDHRLWMLNETEVHLMLAKYTRELQVELKPYLIKATAYSGAPEKFKVRLERDVLYVFHAALGSYTSEMNAVPIVVFSERRLRDVKIDTAIRE